jgi:thioredoxin reductase (NADPH)
MKDTMSSESVRDVIIVGSGPAGYTAAIYAARADLKPLVFEGEIDSGGALMTTTDVENFPGFPDGIMGPELMDKLRAQAERFGSELITEDVVEMELSGDIKTVKDGYGNVFSARTVILAMGSGYRKLGLGEKIDCRGTAFPGVPPVMVFSSVTRTLPWSAAATRRSRKRSS